MMRLGSYCQLMTVISVSFLCLFTIFIQSSCAANDHSPVPAPPSPDNSSACVLDFSTYNYKPSGDCLRSKEKIDEWGSYPTTLCCRNALTVLSEALAIQARNRTLGSDNIFLGQGHWVNCSGNFQRQHSVSIHSCGFENLFYGSSKCSNLSLSNMTDSVFLGEEQFGEAKNNCSTFGSSFDSVCSACAKGVLALRDAVLEKLGVKENKTEQAICEVGVVISLAAEMIYDTSWTDDFFQCLRVLDKLDPDYVKIKYKTVKVVFASLLVIAGFMLIVLLIKYVKRRKPEKPTPSREITTWSGLYRFSKAEIENAINFQNERKSLGRGSAGHVYKGILPSGQAVAIKHINKSNMSDSFTREVEGLSRVRHPNLVCLFGYCIEGGEQYLVYEYCPAGNLAQHLLRKDSGLTWDRRVKILRDCALALRYLHHFIDGCIVHRDIKLTNILLTENLEPKLSDFGLAKMLGMEESKVFTDVRGTIGYMDPEYMSNAKLTCASDIYSFGIVALQLLSGQKVIELDLDARDQLTRKAKDVSMGKRPLSDFEDPRLNGNLNRADFECILQVAVFSVAKSSKDRPTIDTVFEEMDKAWKNTLGDMKTQREINSMATSMSSSFDGKYVIKV
ncbi:proline-rich receptor-like protein kinase PERK3 [Punica granatum]|uniref:Proline-rich receptor-like protein kinase PERK3 n=2 Tax=Punica granatum TaxID=22663 RepID=A0A6P8C521_PUNGR|nr:proline-rich receptor-like protein kinase PERK3 [Punica granatum]